MWRGVCFAVAVGLVIAGAAGCKHKKQEPCINAPITCPAASAPGQVATEPMPVVGHVLFSTAPVPNPQAFMPNVGNESYEKEPESRFLDAAQNPLSTFSIDVDTASYSNVRRFLNQGTLPPKDAIRIEELVNYFDYKYPGPEGGEPFTVNAEVASCPWRPEYRLLRIGIKGREIPRTERPSCNLVFLLDVSGSMSDENKLPLVKRAMQMLIRKLTAKDRVAVVTYAGTSGIAVPSTVCIDGNKHALCVALDQLSAGGSTAGASGLQTAYQVAKSCFIKEGVNRVILCTDGDFNVGITNQADLQKLIEDKAKSGIFLTVLGFGMGNYKDSTLETLADKGNGNYGYIDNINEARKMLVDGAGGTLVTIAKDVKIQVEFNPAEVVAYKLIGYENRLLAKEDFNDDTKDAGEIGAGHTVTALYELVPPGVGGAPTVDDLKYQKNEPPKLSEAAKEGELCTVKLRYKAPDGDVSKLFSFSVRDDAAGIEKKSREFKFAASVAAFGLLLSESPFKGSATFEQVLSLGQAGKGEDEYGYRAEFLGLVRNAKEMHK